MNEFNNRIDAQRRILQIVNKVRWQAEELSGLSKKSIDRWILVNQIDASTRLVELIRAAGGTLFFLANKSQEQVSDDYKHRAQEVSAITSAILTEIARLH